jgi:hypothetical protein
MDIWVAGEDVMDRMRGLIATYHPHLGQVDKEIAILFREKASKAGGKPVLGKTRKAPGILSILGDTEYKFIIELAADEWAGLSFDQQTALLDHHLCACRVEEDEDTQDIKCSLAPPDFIGYRGEVERHGIWRPDPLAENGKESAIEKLFDPSTPEAIAPVKK